MVMGNYRTGAYRPDIEEDWAGQIKSLKEENEELQATIDHVRGLTLTPEDKVASNTLNAAMFITKLKEASE